METALRNRVLTFAARTLEHRLNADHGDYAGAHLPCACGRAARYAGRRARTFISVLGELHLQRAYYYCADCGQGFFPRDRVMGVEDSYLSPGVQRMVGVVGAAVSFAEGADLLHELAGLKLSTRQVEREAERLGRDAAQFEREDSTAPASAPASTMYLGQDGTGVPMRSEALVNRPGKQADGSAKTREMKLCTVWTAEHRDLDGRPSRDPGSVSYTAAIESAETKPTAKTLSPFAQRVEREAKRSGFTTATHQVVLGDGAAWLWNIATECFPNATQILDQYHAKEHIHEVAKAVFGVGTDLAQQWARQRCQELAQGRIKTLIAAIAKHSPQSELARTCASYFTTHRRRMDYPKFEQMGWCVGSGVVEAGCKTAIGVRMKRAGMHWTEPGANAIAALRCCRLSGRYEDFWTWRAHTTRSVAA